jgi:hypothetical protein
MAPSRKPSSTDRFARVSLDVGVDIRVDVDHDKNVDVHVHVHVDVDVDVHVNRRYLASRGDGWQERDWYGWLGRRGWYGWLGRRGWVCHGGLLAAQSVQCRRRAAAT